MFNAIANAFMVATRTSSDRPSHTSELYNHEARKREELHQQNQHRRLVMNRR